MRWAPLRCWIRVSTARSIDRSASIRARCASCQGLAGAATFPPADARQIGSNLDPYQFGLGLCSPSSPQSPRAALRVLRCCPSLFRAGFSSGYGRAAKSVSPLPRPFSRAGSICITVPLNARFQSPSRLVASRASCEWSKNEYDSVYGRLRGYSRTC